MTAAETGEVTGAVVGLTAVEAASATRVRRPRATTAARLPRGLVRSATPGVSGIVARAVVASAREAVSASPRARSSS